MTPGNAGLIKNYDAESVIGKYRICKFGAADYGVALATAATDLVMGVSNILGADAIGQRVDVVRSGIAKVYYGGTVTRGQKLTTDANGAAVTAATTNNVIGVAEISGVAGDIGAVSIELSKLP